MSSSSTGGQVGPTANAAFFQQRQKVNEAATIAYAMALIVIVASFALGYRLRVLVLRVQNLSNAWKILATFIRATAATRRIALRRAPGFSSLGQAGLFIIFMALNIGFSFTRYDWNRPTDFAARFGWMASANLVLVVFLALKNTPLAVVTGHSYERLNHLHQLAGYATLVHMVLHACIYTGFFIQAGNWHLLHEGFVTAGIVLGFSLLTSVVEAVVLRRFKYEAFYVVHILLFVAIVITLGLHRPNLESDKVAIIACLVAGLWATDRLIRLARLLFNGINNRAKIYPLPNGGTRIMLRKPLPRASPGGHCFVWLPKIRLLETHPFSIVATTPMELVVNSYSGFTKDLHRYASAHHGTSLTVSLDGPYGKHPDPIEFDVIVLIAGGSGASFTFGLLVNMLNRMTASSNARVHFVWTAKSHDTLSWFVNHLSAISVHNFASRLTIRLHTTGESRKEQAPAQSNALTVPKGTIFRHTSESRSHAHSMSALAYQKPEEPPQMSGGPAINMSLTAEEGTSSAKTVPEEIVGLPIHRGRPDVAAVIKDQIRSIPQDVKVLIAACGPDGLMEEVKSAVADCIRKDGPFVELHCEKFGW